MTNEFTRLNLHPQLVQTLTDLGYTVPTPIQSSVIPVMLSGKDVVGQAQTGTGKTAAFSLPILQNLTGGCKKVQALVLAPTRELAIQTADALHRYGRHGGVRVMAVYGGQSYSHQIGHLKKGVDIVVGTPGRMLDLIRQKAVDISGISTVVLDEADEMLSMGFIEDIEAILKETPAIRQTALFCATMPEGIRRIAARYMRNPQAFTMGGKHLTVAAIEQRYYLVNEADKLAALTRLFEVEPITSALIFARTRLATAGLANELTGRGFPAEALNGDMTQDARIQVLNRFRNNQSKVLVATDVAARGLDIDDISHVFNYDMPQDAEVYVHRIGRTGRAGKTGIAISLLTPGERWNLGKIESYTRQKVARSVLPTEEDIQSRREASLLEQMMKWLNRGRCQREREIVTELVAGGSDPIAIAAAALKLARGEEKQRPIDPMSDIQEWRPEKAGKAGKRGVRKNGEGNRSNGSFEKGMIRISLGVGTADGIRPNQVMGSLSRHADIPGHAIGKIKIQKQHTYVDIPEKFVGQVLAKAGNYRIGRRNIIVERA
ncbi:MAG: DEAD/DEAH box helicase [Deltaproteobacteria bacterium]|nr:DEAD/DEAH box helicase [Deltaproteobacteria bacterium]